MKTIAARLAITASIAALICATPVSIDLFRAGAAGPDGTAHLALALDTAQAHDAHGGGAYGGREAGSRGAAGGHHQAQSDRRSAGDARSRDFDGNGSKANDVHANNVRANDVRANDVHANDVHANDVHVNDVHANNVNVNDVNAANVNATYVRPPYVARPWAVTGTTAAVGTAVAVLPASCTIVDYNEVTYHHCGDTYYIASNGAYVAVNPPR